MARPKAPSRAASALISAATVSGNTDLIAAKATSPALAASASVFRNKRKPNPSTDRAVIAKPWQIEAYRHVNLCGEARYAVTLFAATASRAEIGISEPQALARKATWVTSGPEVDALAEIAPTVRERSKLIRDFMVHWTIAGEMYLIARDRVATDPGYDEDPTAPVWELVAVSELQKVGDTWRVRHENGNFVDLKAEDPIIRIWNPDPADRQEAWSPFRSLLPTLREIEWLTKHIFTQVQSRLMSAGVWFLPDNLTFPPPPPDAVEGGAEAIAAMNEPEQFMASLAASSMNLLEGDEVAFPSVVMADSAALGAIDQNKLIQFWSEIDDKAMSLRSDAIRRFALGMDLPPEQVLGSSGVAVTNSGGSAGSTNHWGIWAMEEQTISAHVEPALDSLVGTLTTGFLRLAVEGTQKVVAYDTANLRLRQDRSKEAIEWYDRGVLKAEVALRETGFDPSNDMMTPEEHRKWLLNRIAGGSATPEQVQAALMLMGVSLPVPEMPEPTRIDVEQVPAPAISDRNMPPSLESHPYEGPPRVQHDHSPAPFGSVAASCEGLVLRALEKAGNRLLNDGKRGRDKDRSTPPHLAHLTAGGMTAPEFDFTLLPTVLAGLSAKQQAKIGAALHRYCASLYNNGTAYSREGLLTALEGA